MGTVERIEGYLFRGYYNFTRNSIHKSILYLMPLEVCCFFLLFNYPIKSLIFLGILAIIVIVYLKPGFGLYGCVAIRFSGIEYSFSIEGLFAFFAIITFTAWIIRSIYRGKAHIYFDQQGKYLLFFILAGCLSILNAEDYGLGFKALFIWLKDFLFFILVVNLLSKPKHINEVLSVIIGILTLSIAYDFATNGLGTYLHILQLHRMKGFSTDPNYFAITLVMTAPLIFALLIEETTLWKRVALGTLFLLFFTGIVFSYSRGGIIGLISVLPIMFFSRRNLKWNLLSVFLIIFILFQVVPPQFWSRVKSITNLRADLSIMKRLLLFKAGISMFLHHPFLGIGWGNFINASKRYIGLFGALAHNMYLEVLAEGGLIGFIPFVGLIWISMGNFRKASKEFLRCGKSTMYAISKGLMVGFIGFLISGFFLSVQEYKIFIIMLALSSVLKRISGSKISDESEHPIRYIRHTTCI